VGIADVVRGLKSSLVQAKAEKGRWSDYKDLMQELIDQKTVDPQEVELILESVGRSFDELAQDAELFAKRLEWKRQVDEAIRTEPLMRATAQKIAALDQRKADFLAKHALEMSALQEQYRQLDSVVGQRSTAEQGLRQTVQDPLVLYTRTETTREVLALAEQERELDRQLNSGDTTSYRALIPEAKRNADELLHRYSRSGAGYDLKLANEAKSRLNALEENKNRTVAALERVRAEMATLRQKQAEVEKRAMVP
jgi:hypothetical protein